MRIIAVISALLLTAFFGGDQPPPAAALKTFRVPYKLTGTQHVMVRAKFNGKGPFNFILDTGAPAMFTSTAIAKSSGLEIDEKGWAKIDALELEGGLKIDKVKTKVDDLFQLKGVNGLGLAGVELHGVIGYNVLARSRIEFDFTKDRLGWTPLNFEPPPVMAMGGKGGAPGGLEAIGSMMQAVGGLFGLKPESAPTQRGFLGVELEEANQAVTIRAVYSGSPADKAGLKVGDVIRSVGGTKTPSISALRKSLERISMEGTAAMVVERGDAKTAEISVKLGGGF